MTKKLREIVSKNQAKQRYFAVMACLVLCTIAFFVLSSAFWAEGVTNDSQSMSLTPIEELAEELPTAEEALVSNEDALLGMASDSSSTDANASDEAFLSSEETPEDSDDLTVEEVEATDLDIATFAYMPATDRIPGFDPVPEGAVAVGTVATLNTAIANANAEGSTYIYLTQSITGGTAAGAGISNAINNAALRSVDGRQGLTIDGRGHRLTHGTGGDGTFNLTGTTGNRVFTLKNIDIVPSSSSSAAGDNTSVISVAPMGGDTSGWSGANNPASRYWTVNLHNVRTVSAGGTSWSSAAGMRGFLSLSEGTVNFSGENDIRLNQRRVLINARQVNFIGGTTNLETVRTGSAANYLTVAEARTMDVVRARPLAANQALGAGLSLSDGAEVTINRDVSFGTAAREGHAILIHVGAAAAGNVRPATIKLSEKSSLHVTGNPRGTGSSAELNGLVLLRGGSGGTSVADGSELFVHNTRTGTGTNAGTSAFLQYIRGGIFEVSGEDSSATFISNSAQHSRQASLRFYMASGASNQTVSVTDGANLTVERRGHSGVDAAALRFGQGTGNGLEVRDASVSIRNEGGTVRGTFVNPGTSTARGFNAAVEFAANNWFLRVLGDSDMNIEAQRGAAINARGYRNGEIRITEGANFIASGRTAGTGANDGIVRATGGNVHFVMIKPYYYDFVNIRPGGGRIFSLGSGAANTFTSTGSDLSVWRRGVNPWNGEPDAQWTLIDIRLRGAHLRIADAVSYADFIRYYNTNPANSRRMENFTRITGNNAAPTFREVLDLTNADRHVRALADIPQGAVRDPRPVGNNEVWANFTHTCGSSGEVQIISSTDNLESPSVRSFGAENLFEAETDARSVAGSVRLTHEDGRFLRAGDSYQIDEAWRSSEPNLPRSHSAINVPPALEFESVRDVVPPVPVGLNANIVPTSQVNFGGTWEYEDEFDDGPLLGSAGIRLQARTGNAAEHTIAGTGLVNADKTWSFTANSGQLLAGDIVWVSLADTQAQANWNPLTPTPVRDRMIPEASWFVVAPDNVMPVIIQHFFEGAEHIPYRLTSMDLSTPSFNETRTATMGTGASTSEHLIFQVRDRRGYKVESIELRNASGTVVDSLTRENSRLGADGHPLSPFSVSPDNNTIHVNYVTDPDATSDILVEFRFADFGRLNGAIPANSTSWTLQDSVLYPQVRTGSYNSNPVGSRVNRFPTQGLSEFMQELNEFHINDTVTRSQIEDAVRALFEGIYDPDTGEQIVPPAIDGLPRGFVPCPDNFIQLPLQGPADTTQRLTFPVSVGELHDARYPAPSAERRPIVINFVATLEEIEITQHLERSLSLTGSPAQNAAFNNMSFNYQVNISRGIPGGRNADGSGFEGWRDHRLQVIIDSERFEGEGAAQTGSYEYPTRSWHGGNTQTTADGNIRIGTWNNITTAAGGQTDAGTGTTAFPAITVGNSPVGVAFTAAQASANLAGVRRVGIDDTLTVAQIPSTAYLSIAQQINGVPARGVNNVAPGTLSAAADVAWFNNAINNLHFRDFTDSGTGGRYLWRGTSHLPGNAVHTTNWTTVLPYPAPVLPVHNPGRPMDADTRNFEFSITPRDNSTLTVTNHVDGAGADMDRRRYFSVQLRDDNDEPLAEGTVVYLFADEYEQSPVASNGEYEMVPVWRRVYVGPNGTLSAVAAGVTDAVPGDTGLPALLPGESFSIGRLDSLNSVRVVMREFEGQNNYTLTNSYLRPRAGDFGEFDTMHVGPAGFMRDDIEVVFSSYRGAPFVVPAGLFTEGSAVLVVILLVTGTGAAILAVRKRKEIENL